MSSPKKPRALAPGARVRIVSPASPGAAGIAARGLAELSRLGYVPVKSPATAPTKDYFSASTKDRRRELLDAFADNAAGAVICARGGYGSTYLLDKKLKHTKVPRIFLGYSDVTTIQIYLWQKRGWVTFYGPMAASGFSGGAGAPHGYDQPSFRSALTQARGGWSLDLGGSALCKGSARGTLLGGCMTLVEATLSTPWELDTRGAILVLEDRAMKPYQVDRVLTHLRQAGKFRGVRGIILGEFPESAPTVAGSPTVRDVAHRILGDLEIPVVWGARVGHTPRPMLTLPLGVRARLNAHKSGTLEILEPAVIA
jgi:muramoyltetrapeptide carboxypeptidase